MRRASFLCTVFTVCSCIASAQLNNETIKNPKSDLPSSPHLFILTDTAATITNNTSEPRGQKSGALAMAFSAVLPGAGQLYTERYLKIPIIWGFGGYFARQWLKADKLYRQYGSDYTKSVVESGLTQGRGDEQFRYVRDFYRDERDKFGFYIALTYLLNVVDAYVGASLYNFEVNDDLNGGVSLKLRVPIR